MFCEWGIVLAGALGMSALLTGLFRQSRLHSRTREELANLSQAFKTTAQELHSKIQELHASRNQIEGIVQSMSEGVLVFEPDEKLLLVNASARSILGMAPEARLGDSMAEVMRYPDLQRLVRETLATGVRRIRDLELYAPTLRTLQVNASTCEVPGTGRCALLVFHDVTHLKQLEQIRREFVANVSHELKTPLTAIRGAVETLLEGALLDADRGRPFVAAIQEEADRLNRLVEDLLTLAHVEAKAEALKREPVEVRSFLEEQVARYQALAGRHQVRLRLEVREPIPHVSADRPDLTQAIGNLLDNAIKYNRPQGTVTLRAREASGQLVLEVEDTGIGIPPEDLPRIFERFYRVDKARSRERGGTGLGLSIVKHVAEAHGGSVEAQSHPSHGSRFILRLPLN